MSISSNLLIFLMLSVIYKYPVLVNFIVDIWWKVSDVIYAIRTNVFANLFVFVYFMTLCKVILMLYGI